MPIRSASGQSWRALAVFLLVVLAGVAGGADTRINTPFKVVPLWSDEMMSYLTGVTQPACSGTNAPKCARLNSGVCDATAYFMVSPSPPEPLKTTLPRRPSKQTESTNPQYVGLEIWRADASGNLAIFYSPAELDQLELVFHCGYSGNDACPTRRFQTGTVRRVELGAFGGKDAVDLTTRVSVRPDGPIVVAIDPALKESFFRTRGTVYQVRAVAECFSIAQVGAEWKLPLYESPSAESTSAGTIVVRVIPGDRMEFTYRPVAGDDVTFEPDWVQPDWGYTFMADQTVLDRKGDWFRLPRRPFPSPVWIQLPVREPSGVLNDGEIYTLSRTVRARGAKGGRTTVLTAGTNIFVASIRPHALEVRKEEPFDMPCTAEALAAPRREVPTHVVDAPAFYDRDLHLQLRPAYPKGC
ncbi:MAG TPA: hypothetical protein VK886_00700 [Vicinamibacterales bacterium]|nr:hypothetical protein [Vicinamibacterales bacterium]